MKKFLKQLGLVAALAAMVLPLGSAQAASIAGSVEGNVFIGRQGDPDPKTSPGLPITGCAWTKYVFEGVVIVGTLVDSNNNAFTGKVDVSNTKGQSTICESASDGKGTVNTATNQASFAASGVGGNVNGTYYGWYCRAESYVHVDLFVTFSINGGPSSTVPLNVDAHFQATEVDTGQNPPTVEKAAFAGGFQSPANSADPDPVCTTDAP